MVAHLTEEEQLEALKRWWKENGKSTVTIIGILLAGFFGWNQYQDHKVAKANKGSVIFEKFVAATSGIENVASAEQEAKIKAIADEIAQNDGSSLYNDFAQLYLAKLTLEKGDIDSAIQILDQVTADSKDPAVKDLSRLRYARLVAQKGDLEKALQVLSSNVSSAYKSSYEETKGDMLLDGGRISDAHAAYKAAMESLSDDQVMRKNLIQLKIDHTAVASKTSAVEPKAVTGAGDA